MGMSMGEHHIGLSDGLASASVINVLLSPISFPSLAAVMGQPSRILIPGVEENATSRERFELLSS
jgi:hypothetical protein